MSVADMRLNIQAALETFAVTADSGYDEFIGALFCTLTGERYGKS